MNCMRRQAVEKEIMEQNHSFEILEEKDRMKSTLKFLAPDVDLSIELDWLRTSSLDHIIPIAKAKNRTDVTIPKPDTFAKLVETYKVDPCGKLEMLNNGTFVLKKHNSTDKYK